MLDIITKPSLEKIEPGFGSSFTVRAFNDSQPNTAPNWHVHPELELVFLKSGSGKRHIGNHISCYKDGDLVFIGPNLPHMGLSERLSGVKAEIVVQMKQEFLGEEFLNRPEMESIAKLIERSKQGIAFHGKTKKEIGKRLTEITELEPFHKLLALLDVLNKLAHSEDYTLLNAKQITLEVSKQDNERINNLYQFIRANFQRHIPLEEVASEGNMSVPAFCRYFKKVTNKTFTEFVNEFRIAHACKLLNEENMPIADICFESGFNNFSHFNKHFKLITGKSPSDYRKRWKEVLQ
jgi:AraC-like DNA-binding protein